MSSSPLSSSMDRRRFLSTTAIGITGLALAHKDAFAAAGGGLSPLLSIGFAPALPAAGTSVRLADAASLYLPDPSFLSSGARVAVAGSARGAKHLGEPGGVAVDAAMPLLGRAPARFRFWSAAGNGASGNLSFTVPVVATSGIDFVARRMKASTKKEETATTAPADVDPVPFTLSLGSAPGPKLQRGVYVVALRESASDVLTDWSRFGIAAEGGAYSIPGAGFAYVILKIDYAKSVAA
jgi:hypothetical protein